MAAGARGRTDAGAGRCGDGRRQLPRSIETAGETRRNGAPARLAHGLSDVRRIMLSVREIYTADGHFTARIALPPLISEMPFSPATFTTERGPGAFASLGALPRRGSTSKQRRPLFHFDDDNEQDSPPDTPQNVPFPSRSQSSSPASPVLPLTPTNGPPAIKRSDSGSVILSNGRPLKSSLKSASSQSIAAMDDESSIADEDERSMSRPLHMRAQSMPSTPRVHFHDDKLATVRVFRSTGRPRSVSTNELDTETETEVEPAAYPFPRTAPQAAQALMDIDPSPARTSIIPAPNPPQETHVLIESISLPPSRPPVLRGTVLVRNVSFEKRVCIRFTLDDWTTVSEVLATYSSSLSPSANPLARQEGLTIGDLAHRQSQNWDRFAFAIRLEDYESRLADRTLWFVARYTAPGAGEWWDNNSAANYKVSFRPRAAAPVQRKAPSAAPFLCTHSQRVLVLSSAAPPRRTLQPFRRLAASA
ncbi:carbohydrate-binding module family 21 protein [Peniophora sp. CONT]|nr:carbohydrate-binding module family 21 protein [Peniophora sp. CONT]